MYVQPGDRVVIFQGHCDYVGKIGCVITVIGLGTIVEIAGSRAGFPLAWLRPDQAANNVGDYLTSEQTAEYRVLGKSLEMPTSAGQLVMFANNRPFKQKFTHWTAKY